MDDVDRCPHCQSPLPARVVRLQVDITPRSLFELGMRVALVVVPVALAVAAVVAFGWMLIRG